MLQNFKRDGAKALWNESRYVEGRQIKRVRPVLKDARKFRDQIERELWNVERKSPKLSEKFKELLCKNYNQPPYCVHAPEA